MTLRRLSFVLSSIALIAIPTGLYASASSAKSEPKPENCCADPTAGCCDPAQACCAELIEKCKAACEQAKAGGASCEEACATACATVCGDACAEPAVCGEPSSCDEPCQDACGSASAPTPSPCCGGK